MMIDIFVFHFRLLLLYLKLSQFIVNSQLCYFSRCLLQHLLKKPILRVLPGIKYFQQIWRKCKDCRIHFPIYLYFPLTTNNIYFCVFSVLFPTSDHILFSQCSSLINVNSWKSESGYYFLRFSSFHLLRYCYISLVVELEVDQIKTVFIVCHSYLDSCIMVNELCSMFLPPPVPHNHLELLLHLAQILSAEQGLLSYSFTWERGDPGCEERIRLVLSSVPSLATVVILVTAVGWMLVVGYIMARGGCARGVQTSLRLVR
jgi:hypothetical protein